MILCMAVSSATYAQTAPDPMEIDGRKVRPLIGNDPPGVHCNNDIQVAAELATSYKAPILVCSVSFMPPGTKKTPVA